MYMKDYFDHHSEDKEVNWNGNWIDYCNKQVSEKENEWVPFLSFPITQKCNFHCLYCGSGGEATASNAPFTTLETIIRYVNYARKQGIKKIRITGGEPFLHPQIKIILQYLGSTGLYILVNTNGSLIQKNKEWLKSIPDNVKFAVSFDSLNPSVLKTISGTTCHADVVKGIELLKRNGNLLRLNMVINNYNYEEVYKIIHYCQELGCDLKILDVVSVPLPFSPDRQAFYREVDSLENEFSEKCDQVYSHEYTRSFGTPCYRYRFGDVFVTVKNSKKGSHYDIDQDNSLCRDCNYYPCHEGLYDLFCLSDGRLCSCRWTEVQRFSTPELQMQWLLEVFKRARYVYTGENNNMEVRKDLQ